MFRSIRLPMTFIRRGKKRMSYNCFVIKYGEGGKNMATVPRQEHGSCFVRDSKISRKIY